jgi:hypothetical protein
MRTSRPERHALNSAASHSSGTTLQRVEETPSSTRIALTRHRRIVGPNGNRDDSAVRVEFDCLWDKQNGSPRKSPKE